MDLSALGRAATRRVLLCRTAPRQKEKATQFPVWLGAPEETRAPDLLIRSQTEPLHLNTLPYKI